MMKKVLFIIVFILILFKMIFFDAQSFFQQGNICLSLCFVVILIAGLEKVFLNIDKSIYSYMPRLVFAYCLIAIYVLASIIIGISSHLPFYYYIPVGIYACGMLLPCAFFALYDSDTKVKFFAVILYILLYYGEIYILTLSKTPWSYSLIILGATGIIGMIVSFIYGSKFEIKQ